MFSQTLNSINQNMLIGHIFLNAPFHQSKCAHRSRPKTGRGRVFLAAVERIRPKTGAALKLKHSAPIHTNMHTFTYKSTNIYKRTRLYTQKLTNLNMNHRRQLEKLSTPKHLLDMQHKHRHKNQH